jgi:hypothetical protein
VGNLADEAFPIRTGHRTLFVWVHASEIALPWVKQVIDSFP